MSLEDGKNAKVIIIHETPRQGWLRDAATWALAFGLILPGHGLGIEAMEWLGFIVFVIALLKLALNFSKLFTIEEARHRLDEIEESWPND